MVVSYTCPDLSELVNFDLGMLADAEAESVEAHLAECPDCLARLAKLQSRDTLIDAMRGQDTAVGRTPVSGRVQALMERLKALRSSAAITPAPEQTPSPELKDVLRPAQKPGELGRLGSFRILRVLGAGGMGIVFEAQDEQLDRRVALKAVRPELAANAPARQRFLREARAAAAVEHDRLVPIYQVGEDQGVPYLAMQLLQGETLENRLQREGRLPLPDVVRIGLEVAEGLAAAHRRGLIHRDIKPANIWLEQQDETGHFRVKILDFGLARPSVDDVNLTNPGVFVGTPLYGAPEQASGELVDARCDLFSLGSVLYALCTGQPPFAGTSNLAVLRRVCDETPRPIQELNPEVPDWLVALIGRLLAKKPADRYQSAAEVVAELARPREQEQMESADSPSRAPEQRAPARGRVRTAVVATALLVPLVGLCITEAAGLTDLRSSAAALLGKHPVFEEDALVQQGSQAVGAEEGANQQPVAAKVFPVALFPFQERGAAAKGYGEKVSDLLFAKLAGRPDLVLVDREDLNKVLKEQELNLSGLIQPVSAARVGQLTGAKILVSGSVLYMDKKLHLVAKVVGTETSRLFGAEVEGNVSDDLGSLVGKLACEVAEIVTSQSDKLVAPALPRTDQLAQLTKKLGNAKRPALMIKIGERHVGRTVTDPAAQTELERYCKATGFTVIDPEGARGQADVLITGEGVSELATRNGALVSVKARVEVKAVDRKTDRVLAVDRQTTVVVDLAEQIAGKTALEQAAATIAQRLLPKLVQK